jgi:hypothetical protein
LAKVIFMREGHLVMSAKERLRLQEVHGIQRGETSVTQASLNLGMSVRQTRRIWTRYQSEGDVGLVHRHRGRASQRRLSCEHRCAVLAAYERSYLGFGPTLASEKLAERDGLTVHPETLRLWLAEEGVRPIEKRPITHRSRRARKDHFGELVQLDGSVHNWFEDRGPKCFMMNMVDDAQGTTLAIMAPEETTVAAMQLLEAWIRKYGIPRALYLDRKTVYVTDRAQTPEEELSGTPALTQFGRACHKLGIELVRAYSPQAKGRVERNHGVHQDRTLKEFRLERISSIAGANQMLGPHLASLNEKFALAPKSDVDFHRPLAKGVDLRSIFCLEETRVLAADWTIRFEGQTLQVIKQANLPCSKSKLTVQRWQDGSLHLVCKERELAFKVAEARQPRLSTVTVTPREPYVPAADHPWRGNSTKAQPFVSRNAIEEFVDHYVAVPSAITSQWD